LEGNNNSDTSSDATTPQEESNQEESTPVFSEDYGSSPDVTVGVVVESENVVI